MAKSALSTVMHVLKSHTSLLIILSFAMFSYSSSVEARTVPRSSSRTIRFPTSDEDHISFEDSGTLFLTQRTRENNNLFRGEQNQGRTNGVISLNNTPIKVLVPQSPSESESGDDTVSSKNVEDLKNDDELHNNVEHGKNSREDEALKEALCPPTKKSNSSSVAANLNKDESDIGTSSAAADNKFRYDLKIGKCAQVGERAHCGENMMFVADIDSAAYGYCECDFNNKIPRRESKQGAVRSWTPLVFHLRTNACYRLYEQAYCNEGEWLVLSRKEKGPVCEQKRCPSITGEKDATGVSKASVPTTRRRASKLLTPSFWTDSPSSIILPESAARKANNASGSAPVDGTGEAVWVPLNGSGPCVKLFEKNTEHCEEDEQVVINVGDIEPKCGFPGSAIEGRAIIRNACPPGSYYSIIGRCQPDWDF